MLSLLIALGIGLVAGTIAHVTVRGGEPDNVVLTMLLGLAGSIMAWLLGRAYGWYVHGEWPGVVGSTLGAVAVLAIHRWVTRATHLP